MDNKTKEFLTKLSSLMAEYDVSIGFNCSPCSDTYGIYGASMGVSVQDKDTTVSDSWQMDCRDIKKLLKE